MRIATGLHSGRGAAELRVTWPRAGHTAVAFIGEHKGSEPCLPVGLSVSLRGCLSPAEVLVWYLDQMRMLRDEEGA